MQGLHRVWRKHSILYLHVPPQVPKVSGERAVERDVTVAKDQKNPRSSLASSDIISGAHGGSQTSSTLTSVTPCTPFTFSSTQVGSIPATGQAGDVRVM